MLAELTQTVSRVEQNQLVIVQAVRSLDERVRVLAKQQATLIELLTPKEKPKKGGPGLDGLLAEMVVRLGQQNERADARYRLYLTDFMATIVNLKRGTRMDAGLLNFLRERDEGVTKLLNDVRSFKKELREQVGELGPLIDVRSQDSVTQFFWRETDKLADLLVHDVKVSL